MGAGGGGAARVAAAGKWEAGKGKNVRKKKKFTGERRGWQEKIEKSEEEKAQWQCRGGNSRGESQKERGNEKRRNGEEKRKEVHEGRAKRRGEKRKWTGKSAKKVTGGEPGGEEKRGNGQEKAQRRSQGESQKERRKEEMDRRSAKKVMGGEPKGEKKRGNGQKKRKEGHGGEPKGEKRKWTEEAQRSSRGESQRRGEKRKWTGESAMKFTRGEPKGEEKIRNGQEKAQRSTYGLQEVAGAWAVFTSAAHVVSESSAGAIPIKVLVGFDSFLVSKKSVILLRFVSPAEGCSRTGRSLWPCSSVILSRNRSPDAGGRGRLGGPLSEHNSHKGTEQHCRLSQSHAPRERSPKQAQPLGQSQAPLAGAGAGSISRGGGQWRSAPHQEREYIDWSPGVCAALAMWAPGVRKAAAGSGAWSSSGSSCRQLTAPLLPGAPRLLARGSGESGSPRCPAIMGCGYVSPDRGVAARCARTWLHWRRRGIRPEDRQLVSPEATQQLTDRGDFY
ncbi:hypothetical protein NDU88_002652 [Pleurodeles waltl]|uniref:Uncharacterized protein n=1 Tax=Pleurodeles waltl TaxID=8319 RepID=A0AAV7NH17_PLEWA|nr:hypothetical protein NDU88_002652 [Pleurodeles waltl]